MRGRPGLIVSPEIPEHEGQLRLHLRVLGIELCGAQQVRVRFLGPTQLPVGHQESLVLRDPSAVGRAALGCMLRSLASRELDRR